MGINRQTLQLMLLENKYKKIQGDFLCIGKQTVNVDISDMKTLFSEYNLDDEHIKKLLGNNDIDIATRHANDNIFDHDLISSFSDNVNYSCLDRSNYEGANIIHDMNTPLPDLYKSKFDFIYNGSCMDNVFNPVLFLQNTTNMLKPGGRIVHVECASSVAGAYLMYSPEWFFSYYAINNFVDCKIYVSIARDGQHSVYKFRTDLYAWQPYFERDEDYNYIEACKTIDGLMHVIVIAEKGADSTSDKNPIQMQYIDENAEDWREKYEMYKTTSRPLLNPATKNKDKKIPLNSTHYTYLGSDF